MKPLPYLEAFERIRAEYLEMPGMRLTPAQVQRLSGVDISVCRLVLDDLVRTKFLCTGPDGSYMRGTEIGTSRLRTAKAGWSASAPTPASRHAS
jgi:hypothetical protein